MRALGILLIGAAFFVGSCSSNCDKNTDMSGATNDTMGTVVGTSMEPSGAMDNTGNTATGANTGTSGEASDANTGTNASGNNASGNNGATMHYESNSQTGQVKSSSDPRKYDEQSTGGVGYRADSIKSYKGKDGSARDKTTDKVVMPK
jgi:hypothetical protein